MKKDIDKLLKDTIYKLYRVDVDVSLYRDDRHGDFTTAIAFKLEKLINKNHTVIADEIASKLKENSVFKEVTVS